jgi:hypothetical protein
LLDFWQRPKIFLQSIQYVSRKGPASSSTGAWGSLPQEIRGQSVKLTIQLLVFPTL